MCQSTDIFDGDNQTLINNKGKVSSTVETWAYLRTRPFGVVLVTQGTIDTGNLDRVIGPTLRALADEDILVVTATGGLPVERLGPLPANARVERFIPFDQLLTHVRQW